MTKSEELLSTLFVQGWVPSDGVWQSAASQCLWSAGVLCGESQVVVGEGMVFVDGLMLYVSTYLSTIASCVWMSTFLAELCERCSRPHSVSDYSKSRKRVNICMCVLYFEPVLRSEDYVWPWIKKNHVLMHACLYLRCWVSLRWRVYMVGGGGASIFEDIP